MDNNTYNTYHSHQNNHYDQSGTPYKLTESKSTMATKSFYETSPDSPTFRKLPFRLSKWRWVALALMNCALIGYFAVFDGPQPLQTVMKERLKIDDNDYAKLYSYLAVPNIILPLIAGYFVDAMGVRIALVLFGTIIVIGQGIYSLGGHNMDFDTMIIGRVVYSLGADPLNIAQIVMVNRWFKGGEVALGLALGTLMAGGGKALNSAVVPAIYDSTGSLAAPMDFGLGLTIFSLVCIIIMVIFDKANENREISYNSNYLSTAEHSEKVDLRAIRSFKPLVWLLVLNFGIFDGVIFTLRSVLNDLHVKLYKYTPAQAGGFISLHYLAMAFISPIAGKVIDLIGKRSTIVFVNSFLGIFSFLFYLVVPSCVQCALPIIPLILFGIYVGVDDAAVFASLPLILEEKYLGTGYGLFYVFENLLLFVLPFITSAIKQSFTDEADGYYWMILFMLGLAGIASIESAILYYVDRKYENSILDKTIFKPKESPERLLENVDDYEHENLHK